MSFVLIDEDDVVVCREGERLIVRRGVVPIGEVRAHGLDSLISWGRVEITRPALEMLLSRDVAVHFVSSTGRYRGMAIGANFSRFVDRRRAQYEALSRTETRIELAKRLVYAGLSNQAAVIRRWNWRREDLVVADALQRVRLLRAELHEKTSLDSIRGVEGNGSRLLYSALGCVLPEGIDFTSRARRPPPDPVNVLLSLFGALLVGMASSSAQTVGLDPCLGILHGHARGGPSLGMDIADVYRPMLSVSVAASLFSKRMLTTADFRATEGGIRLTRKGSRRALGLFAAACRRGVRRRGLQTGHDYIEQMIQDAETLSWCFLEGDEAWSPLVVR